MIHYTRVIQGLMAYIENEMASKLAGSWKAWLLRGAAGIASAKAEPLFRMLAGNPIVTALGLIDGENVNVDVIMGELRKQAQAGPATIDIPMIGPYTIGLQDVEALNRYMRGA
jgi:hypothetical protein